MDSLKACPNPACQKRNTAAARFCRVCGSSLLESGYEISGKTDESASPTKMFDELYVWLALAIIILLFMLFG